MIRVCLIIFWNQLTLGDIELIEVLNDAGFTAIYYCLLNRNT